MKLPDQKLPWPIVWPGVVEIARSEGCRLKAYQDVVGVWTIGWGQTADIEPGMVWTQSEADQNLLHTLTTLQRQVIACCEVVPTPNELAAMVSLAYNIGIGWEGTERPAGARNGFRQSSVLRAHNRGDHGEAARAFGLWNKAKGRVVDGLVARRSREAGLYLTPVDYGPTQVALVTVNRSVVPGDGARDSDVRAVGNSPDADSESALHESPIARSGVASIATAALAAASAASDQVKGIAAGLGIDPLAVLAVVAAVVGVVVLYQRFKQRREGWA